MENKKRSRIRVIVGSIVVFGVAAGVWGYSAYAAHRSRNAGPAVPAELTVDRLKADAAEDPLKVFNRMREARERKDLTDEQREQIRENLRAVRDAKMKANENEFFAAKTADEREAILNRHIDELQVIRKEFEKDRENEANKPKDPEQEKKDKARREEWMKRMRNSTPEQRKERSERRNPNDSARRMAYWSAMQKQMEKRGIEPPRFGGGPGGGGPGRWGR